MTQAPAQPRFIQADATATLPYVTRVVEDIQRVYAEIVAMRKGSESDSPVYEAEMDKLGLLVDELHDVGVELASFDPIIVHFPQPPTGKRVWCWVPARDQNRILVAHPANQDCNGHDKIKAKRRKT